ncbi:MAG: hypothetical protein IJ306_01045 [Oscillospiraceae bacterium]|nr:hypothetical protein [Oscillospiraceae bacterium]
MKIRLGDRVRIHKNGKVEHGTCIDVLLGTSMSTQFYNIVLKNGESRICEENEVVLDANDDEYTFFIDVVPEKNVVIAKMNVNGKEIARGHGHVIHTGDLGIAQATSYAFKKIYDQIFEQEGENL